MTVVSKRKYLKRYRWRNIYAMMKGGSKDLQECTDDFHGRLVVITGATSGIGYVTAREYATHGANLLMAPKTAAESNPSTSFTVVIYHCHCSQICRGLRRTPSANGTD